MAFAANSPRGRTPAFTDFRADLASFTRAVDPLDGIQAWDFQWTRYINVLLFRLASTRWRLWVWVAELNRSLDRVLLMDN